MITHLTAKLTERMRQPLPGLSAQLQMASAMRVKAAENYSPDTSSAKKSAVLIALYQDKETVRTVLIKRPRYNGTHSGQVSFPGGKKEPSDADAVETALREAQEEVGIRPEAVEVIGQLTELYIPPSNFLVYPIIGVLHGIPELRPDQHEVSSILTPELKYLFRNDIISEKEISISNGFSILTPYFTVDGHTVWGATAMIISELRSLMTGMIGL